MRPNLILKTATRFAILLLLLAMAAASSCSIAGVRHTSAAVSEPPDPLTDFTGLWSGTSTSTVNAAKVKVSFDVKREGKELEGTYQCVPLNAVCRDNVQRGWMHGSISARGFTVSMEDTSWLRVHAQRVLSGGRSRRIHVLHQRLHCGSGHFRNQWTAVALRGRSGRKATLVTTSKRNLECGRDPSLLNYSFLKLREVGRPT
jgi:hypothetical protein